ncbi:SpoIIE family protein phosphatase [Nocardioides panacis]|uniref:SpoIIE family protein phosphatase n=1 Tax=Nocardioides panacis TaxID=2849501 RepID=A0A975SXB8_9ACTN|nr:SpoIIE family protein phosphatase [Nocardioides panacis]QWZ07576.1 SpoIIE family protein phosphatase [Nocardioides panacis]
MPAIRGTDRRRAAVVPHDQEPAPRQAGCAVDLDDPRRLAAARRLQPATPGNEVLDRLSGLAARLLRTSSAQVSLLTDLQVVTGGAGAGAHAAAGAPTSRADSLCTVTARSGAPLVVGDAPLDSRVEHLPPVRTGAVGSYLGVPLADAHGWVVGAFCVYDEQARTWSDDEVTVLEELAQATSAELERAATEGERDLVRMQLGLAIESGGIGSWEWDLVAGTMSGNSRLLEMFGVPGVPGDPGDQEHLPRPVAAFVDRVHPEDRPRVARSVATAVETGGEYAEEYRVIRPDGSERWLAARGRPLYDAHGSVVHLVGAVYDTTDRRVAAESVQSEASLMALIARASDLLASSLEAEDAVRSFARLVVPVLADWSVVSLVGDDGRLVDVDWWHHDPEQRDLTGLFARHRLDDREEAVGSLAALRSGEPFVENDDALGVATRVLRSEVAVRAVTGLGLRSVGVFPLVIDDRVIGLITLARGENRPPFTPAEIRAASDLSRRAGITLANAQSFGREREMSEQLQRSMLTEPVAPDDVEVSVRYIPAARAAQIGGDWYDAFAQEDGATVLVVGDVVGHDSVAAAVMGQLRSVLRGIAVAGGGGPARLLGDLDRALVTLRMSTNATVVVARVEEREDGEKALTWSNAGHPPPVMITADGRGERLGSHDVLLGVVPELERHEESLVLEPSLTVLMYTDGLVERRGEDIDVGIDRLLAAAAAVAEQPLEKLVDSVLAELCPEAPDDDVVLLALRRRPYSEPPSSRDTES